jgi:large conductance mechanosensitive channel
MTQQRLGSTDDFFVQQTRKTAMGMIQDFKDFAFKGNLIDMAVGIVMGGAVAAIVKSFLDNIITPLVASVLKVPDMSALKFSLGTNEAKEETFLKWGSFLQNTLDFIILAFVIFLALKVASKFMKKAQADAPTPADIVLLTEIRDSLKRDQPRRP